MEMVWQHHPSRISKPQANQLGAFIFNIVLGHIDAENQMLAHLLCQKFPATCGYERIKPLKQMCFQWFSSLRATGIFKAARVLVGTKPFN
jgi:hypothetical protein